MKKTLLILGGGSDIGQAIGHEFAANGLDIILAARSSDKLAVVQSDFEIRHSIKAYIAEFDAEDVGSHQAFYFGLPAAPDVVLYSVGYLGDQEKAESDWEEAERIINANYIGAASILSIAANDLASRGGGSIIGISSVAGERGRQSNYFYGSAKSGFTTFLDGLRHRLASSNVNVITVKPGFIETKMIANMDPPKLLTGRPEGLAKAVYRAYCSKRSMIYYLPIWREIMMVVRNVPERLFIKSRL